MKHNGEPLHCLRKFSDNKSALLNMQTETNGMNLSGVADEELRKGL